MKNFLEKNLCEFVCQMRVLSNATFLKICTERETALSNISFEICFLIAQQTVIYTQSDHFISRTAIRLAVPTGGNLLV